MSSSHQAFSDCVYRCLVVMDTKETTPTFVSGQPTFYHDFTFHEQVREGLKDTHSEKVVPSPSLSPSPLQVCELYFSCLPPLTYFHLSTLKSLIRKFPDNPYLISR